jgi:hypothetical protein
MAESADRSLTDHILACFGPEDIPSLDIEPMRFLRHREVVAWQRRRSIAAVAALVRQGKTRLPMPTCYPGGPLVL